MISGVFAVARAVMLRLPCGRRARRFTSLPMVLSLECASVGVLERREAEIRERGFDRRDVERPVAVVRHGPVARAAFDGNVVAGNLFRQFRELPEGTNFPGRNIER